jgi:hypothetical protein
MGTSLSQRWASAIDASDGIVPVGHVEFAGHTIAMRAAELAKWPNEHGEFIFTTFTPNTRWKSHSMFVPKGRDYNADSTRDWFH